MPKTILIASNSLDQATTQPVMQQLNKRGYSPLLFATDKIARCQIPFCVRMSNAQKPCVEYDGHVLDLADVGAAWYRRPTTFKNNKADEEVDKGRYDSLLDEYVQLQKYVWAGIPQHRWLNSLDVIHAADDKLSQLALARNLGFLIPDTVVSNQWQKVVALPADPLVLKMPRGLLAANGGTKALYTTIIPNNARSLPLHSAPYPGIWQAYITKKREWRITVVGDRTFDMAIYTAEQAKHDWRRHQASSAVVFKKETFPGDLQRNCVRMTKQLGLRYGAFDFVEKPNGDIIFLEVNPNGQYAWVEKELHLPISEAIADELAAIAGGR